MFEKTISKRPMRNSKTCRVIVKHVMCNLQKRMRLFKNMFDHKGAIQVLRNADGGGGVSNFPE